MQDHDPWMVYSAKGRVRPAPRTLECFVPVGALSSIEKVNKKTGQEWHSEEMPLASKSFSELISEGDSLLELGRKVLEEGSAGMAAPVPWLAPLPNSSDPNMFKFGLEPNIPPHFLKGLSGGM